MLPEFSIGSGIQAARRCVNTGHDKVYYSSRHAGALAMSDEKEDGHLIPELAPHYYTVASGGEVSRAYVLNGRGYSHIAFESPRHRK